MTLNKRDIKGLSKILGDDLAWALDVVQRFPKLDGGYPRYTLFAEDGSSIILGAICRYKDCLDAVKSGEPCRHMRLFYALSIYLGAKQIVLEDIGFIPHDGRSRGIQMGRPQSDRRKY